jgi:hypothetical protein
MQHLLRQSNTGHVGASQNAERRASKRFPLALELRFTLDEGHEPTRVGTGRTIDVSSSGLRFTADRPLLIGHRILAYIDWPAVLNGDIKLQLVISGVVIRTDGSEVAIKIERHDFKTRSARPESPHESVG